MNMLVKDGPYPAMCGHCNVAWDIILGRTTSRTPLSVWLEKCPYGGCDPEVWDYVDEATGYVRTDVELPTDHPYRPSGAFSSKRVELPKGSVARAKKENAKKNTPKAAKPAKKAAKARRVVEAPSVDDYDWE